MTPEIAAVAVGVVLVMLALLLTRTHRDLPDFADPDAQDATLEEFLDESVPARHRGGSDPRRGP